MKKIRALLFFFFFITAFFFFASSRSLLTYASCDQYEENTTEKTNCLVKESQISALDDQIREYEQKLEETKKKEGDIKQNIEYLDNQIYLSKLRIQESEAIIEKRKQDIENLINKIIVLEEALDKNVKLFLKRINLSYRQGNISPFTVFFGSGSVSEKMNKFKYLQIVQSADRQFLFKIQETKNSYNMQKKLVESEKKALERENQVLEERKAVLAGQLVEKEDVLAETQSEEKVLSATVEDLKRQRTALIGGASTGGLGVCDGCSNDAIGYFNQRDSRWGNISLAYNPPDPYWSMKDWGCAVTATAMVLKRLGVNLTPYDIAVVSNFFDDVNIKWATVSGSFGRSYTIDKRTAWGNSLQDIWAAVDSKVSEGKWVIVHIPSAGHYVVITSKSGDDYSINDPYWNERTKLFADYGSGQGIIDEVHIYE